jgi:hypothetical protein
MSPILAHSVISLRCKICPLLDNSGQRWILAYDGLSANDPTETLAALLGDIGWLGPMTCNRYRIRSPMLTIVL